jgi:hypothetical protein
MTRTLFTAIAGLMIVSGSAFAQTEGRGGAGGNGGPGGGNGGDPSDVIAFAIAHTSATVPGGPPSRNRGRIQETESHCFNDRGAGAGRLPLRACRY